MTMTSTSLLISSGLSKFRYAVSDTAGRVLGELRLKTLPKDPIVLDFGGRTYRIDYVVTSNRFIANDFRFNLVDSDGKILASADKMPGKRMFSVAVGDATYRFENRKHLFSLGYGLIDANGKAVGGLTETTGFSLWRRRFRFDLPAAIDGPTGMFLFFLAVNLHFR
jgi:hypothetical protein